MTWKNVSSVVRRLEFVKLALKAQQSMSQLCRLFGLSRKNGYKWKARFLKEGMRGLRDRTRRPGRSPQRIDRKWLVRIGRLRRRHRNWGSRKLAARLRKDFPRQRWPAARTIGKWLKQMKLNGRTTRRSRRGPPLIAGPLTAARRSNQVWTVDFKGWFRTQDGQRAEPLTVRDLFSRYVLAVRLLPNQNWKAVRRVFLGLFGCYGYPTVIRMDNGSPFGSTGPAGLSQLSAWWTSLGIRVEFIAPGHPEQNGAHEQMHRVLKAETTKPASQNRRAQQRRMLRWVRLYNQIRPHEALKQRVPGEVYHSRPASRYRQSALKYPRSLVMRRVRSNGQIRWRGRLRFVGEAFVGYRVGLKLSGRNQWGVYFGRLLIGQLWETDPGGLRPSRYLRGGAPGLRQRRVGAGRTCPKPVLK
jgi:putative transposase